MKLQPLLLTAFIFAPSITLAQSALENPQPNSFQSGIGMFSGWACGAGRIEIAVNGNRVVAASGTARGDTASICGRTDTGFGLLYNFNNLGTGRHTAQLFVNGVAQSAPSTFNVTAPAGEFLRGASGSVQVPNFPAAGRTATLIWQESQQNFVIQSVTESTSESFPFAGTYQCSGAGATDNAQGTMVITSSGGAEVNMVSPISGVYRGTGQVSAQGVLNASGVVQGLFTVTYSGTFTRSTATGRFGGAGAWQSNSGASGTWTCG
jgi:hypothetical protein